MKTSKLMRSASLILVAAVGCQTPLIKDATAEKKANDFSQVTEIVCLWEPSDGIRPDGSAARGIAGQLMFFEHGKNTPVKVDGVVKIYQFDDFGTPEEQARPIHTFTFDSVAWNVHLAESTLGPAYNVFIPYMRKHPYETTSAVRVRFEPANGSTAYSSLASVTLPGAPRPSGDSAVMASMKKWQPNSHRSLGTASTIHRDGDRVTHAFQDQVADASNNDGKGLRTLTIPTGEGRGPASLTNTISEAELDRRISELLQERRKVQPASWEE